MKFVFKTGKMSRGVKWNEDNLAENERTKCATMTIDEPPTPFNFEYCEEEEEEEGADEGADTNVLRLRPFSQGSSCSFCNTAFRNSIYYIMNIKFYRCVLER